MSFFRKLGERCGCKKNESESTTIPQDESDLEESRTEGRAQWASPTEFLLTCVGYSVGLGNVWRFPYLCYKSGGGAFMLPYCLMICFIGMPLLFMEYAFGQYFGIGSLSIFKKVCPMFQGIGIGYVVLNALVCIYYNVIIALSLYYLFASFNKNLPWASCDNEWNTDRCGDYERLNDTYINSTLSNITSYTEGYFSYNLNSSNSTASPLDLSGNRTSPTEEYFQRALLAREDWHNVSNLGEIRWHLCLCLLLSWILVVLFVSRGIQSTGKVAYFTATFPYVMLTVLVVRGVTLPGAAEGVLYFLTPQWEKLGNPEIWYSAATQLFYSTNLAWGGMITMASYNSFNHNCFRDAIMINIVSFLTSLYAGFAVFSIIGYMANEYNLDIENVIKSGPELAFVVYPRALSLMPLAPMWSALFFFMLFLLGIGSQMVQTETIMTGIVDNWTHLATSWQRRLLTVICVCSVGFLIGIPCTFQGGMHVLQLMDHYAAGFCVLVIAVVECVVINWIYKNEKFSANVKEMLSHKPALWWRICWKYISPLLLLAVLVYSLVDFTRAKYGSYEYPLWADGIGLFMTLASVLPIFMVAGYKLYKAPGSDIKERWINVTTPVVESKEETAKGVDTSMKPKTLNDYEDGKLPADEFQTETHAPLMVESKTDTSCV